MSTRLTYGTLSVHSGQTATGHSHAWTQTVLCAVHTAKKGSLRHMATRAPDSCGFDRRCISFSRILLRTRHGRRGRGRVGPQWSSSHARASTRRQLPADAQLRHKATLRERENGDGGCEYVQRVEHGNGWPSWLCVWATVLVYRGAHAPRNFVDVHEIAAFSRTILGDLEAPPGRRRDAQIDQSKFSDCARWSGGRRSCRVTTVARSTTAPVSI